MLPQLVDDGEVGGQTSSATRRRGHDAGSGAPFLQLELLLAVGAGDRPDLRRRISGVDSTMLDDASERLEGDLAGLGGRDDEPLAPQEQAGEDAHAEQVGLAGLAGDDDAADAGLPCAVVAVPGAR